MITTVMGILNITPDSFSDGGKYFSVDDALFRAEKMIEEGAGIIDVGGESTRPGASPVPEQEEIERVIPVIEALKERFDVPISLDTYKAGTAKLGIEAGAGIINDISGLSDPAMGEVISKTDVIYILTHNSPEIYDGPTDIYVNHFLKEFEALVRNAHENGIPDERLIGDPGIGFHKTPEQNLAILKNLNMLCKLKYKVLLGVSRKSVIGHVLDLPVDERLEGTLALTAWAVMNGVKYIRVHDVKENVRLIRMLEAVL